jgi:SAM-dependent methyltransferase
MFTYNIIDARDRELALASNPTSVLLGSSALIPDLLDHMSGIVLDLGPGTGSQLPLMKPLVKGGKVRKIYGAEPCTFLHQQLQTNVDDIGLTDEYTIVDAPADKTVLLPALRGLGVFGGTNGISADGEEAKGTPSRRRTRASAAAALAAAEAEGDAIFDTIVCIRVLCSVPNPEKTIADLYNMLKPGGKMIVLEHIRNRAGFGGQGKGSLAGRAMQILYHAFGWSFFLGDCHMDRDTQASLLNAPTLAKTLRGNSTSDGDEVDGDEEDTWEVADLTIDFEWSPLPYVSGVLVKRK